MIGRRPKKLPLENLDLRKTAGHAIIHLTTKVTPDGFSRYARDLLAVLDGTVEKKIGSPFEQLWEVRIQERSFRLACDEAGASLEPEDEEASRLVPLLYETLISYRDKTP